ncbi:MAG: hypothetical protein LHW64_01115 [Candidatus Cloacimonetes bacterium]|jgi:hypothetical protein|nr:hypothetical protein [Candidatus Cloacimonadota bacterium]MCB5286387.1 hypothetical protein [Candidatus Cloacimonadota bacterium]MCK9184459.1 hypothetical protein [Candidatus Cloacimonadota bacterium]MCK9584127.1 hypothetical protein [Candidatus Cloacimonadota bacterium]MDY0228709.1 hypothetical protein [Candidatus Cloacimonadaceae bacterium]
MRSALLLFEFKNDSIKFEGSHSPPKTNILRFGGKLTEPFRFEAERNLKIIIELEYGLDSLQQFERAVEILGLWE